MTRHAAFTLFELLVVISIIALLVSMFMPAITLVRDAARGTACTSHLRQIALAFHGYANDQDGWFPPVNNVDHTNNGQWYTNLLSTQGYLPEPTLDAWGGTSRGVWRCPGLTDAALAWGSYGILRDSLHGSQSNAGNQHGVLRGMVSRAADRVLVADAEKVVERQSIIYLECPLTSPWNALPARQAAPRHGKGRISNVAFHDGHAGGVHWDDLRADINDCWRHASL